MVEWCQSFFLFNVILLFFSQIRELMEDDPELHKDLLEVRLTTKLIGCMRCRTFLLYFMLLSSCSLVCVQFCYENTLATFPPKVVLFSFLLLA